MIQSLAHTCHPGARVGESLEVPLWRLTWGELAGLCQWRLGLGEHRNSRMGPWLSTTQGSFSLQRARQKRACAALTSGHQSYVWETLFWGKGQCSLKTSASSSSFQLGLCSRRAMGRSSLSHQASDPRMTGLRHLEMLPFSGCFPSNIPS